MSENEKAPAEVEADDDKEKKSSKVRRGGVGLEWVLRRDMLHSLLSLN